MKDLSKPNDSRVEIKKSGEKKYAAISFNGYNNDYKFNLYSKKLKEFLDSENIDVQLSDLYRLLRFFLVYFL